MSLLIPMITAVKSAAMANDVNGNGFVNPGDTLMYSVVVANSGTDAMNVVFTDTLDANLTLVGSAIASPIAVNDSYTSIGNVGITVPAANGLLANDVNPQGTGTIAVVAAAGGTAQGGAFSVGSNGSFSYLSQRGFEGVDTFTYTLIHSNGKSDTGIVTVNVSGMIWFINAAAPGGGTGVLSNPYNTLAAFQAANNGAGNNPATGDNIFIYAGNYTGPLTLLNNQKVFGAGSGAGTTLAGLTGLTLPPFSNTLPATTGTRPELSHSSTLLTLASGNTIRGFNVSNSGGNGITGSNFGNLTADLVNVTATGSCTSAMTLTNGNPTASFTAINATGCTNGIVLSSTTGSFIVTGDGTLARNASGGTLNNIQDDGVALTNATNVTLQSMNLTNIGNTNITTSTLATTTAGDHAVQISGGSNVILSGVYIQNPKGGVLALDLGGTNRINNNSRIEDLTANSGHGIYASNTTTSMTLFELNNMQMVDNASSYSNVYFATGGTGNMALTVTNSCVFEDLGVQAITASGGLGTTIAGTLTTNINGNTFQNAKGTGENNVGILTNGGPHTATVNNNTFNNIAKDGSISNASIIRTQNNGGQMTATVSNNTITNIAYTSGGRHVIGHVFEPVAYSVANFSNITFENNNATNITYTGTNREFIFVDYRDNASGGNVKILGNAFTMLSAGTQQLIELRFRQTNASTVNVRVNGNVGTGNTSTGSGFFDIDAEGSATVNSTVTSNNFTNSNGTPGPTLSFATEALVSTMCANISGNTLFPATITLNETAGVMNITQPSSGNLGAVNGGAAITVTGTPTFNSGACTLPPLMAPLGGSEGEVTRNGGGKQQTIFERLQDWVRPIFSAFAAPVSSFNVGRLSNWVTPVASAAGNDSIMKVAPAAPEQPRRTMIVDRATGNYRIVPTAALPAMMPPPVVGTIVIDGGGAGFTLPAGESTTIMFNATIAAGFTGSVMTNQAAVSGSGFATVLSNNLVTPVFQPVTITKAFSPTRISPGGASTVTLTLSNINPVAQTNASFTDLLTNMTAVGGAAGGTCVGASSNVLGVGATNLSFSGITVPPGSSCTVTFAVTSSTTGVHPNQTSGVTTAQTTPTAGPASNTANLTVAAPPTISKAFGAATIPLNGSTSLTLSIANPNASLALSGIAVTDTLPAGLVVATPNGLANTCGGTVTAVAGSSSVSLTGGALAASGNCTITVNVRGTTAGVKNNTTGNISSTESGAGGTASASVTVVAPPVISKAFGAATIPLNGSTSLTFTITNNNSVSASGVTFVDNLPAGLVVASPNGLVGNCGGTVTATSGAGTIDLIGGTIAPNVDCVFSVNVTGTTAGVKNNTTVNVSSINGGIGNAASASVTVLAPPTISKAFGASNIPLNGMTTLTLTIGNPNAGNSLTGVAVTDTFPAGLVVATPNGLANTCGGSVTATAGTGSVSLTGGTIPASGSCTVTVNVTGTTPGSKVNITGTVSSTNGGTGQTAIANLTVATPPTITKSFGAPTIPLNGSTSMTLTIANPNASVALSGIAVTDNLPAGLVVATPNGLANTCGGTATAVAGSGSVSLTGGALAASGNCTVTVNVTGTTAGVKNNTTGNVSSTETGAGGTGSATVTVVAPPSIAKAFGAPTIPLNGSTSLTFTIQNNNSTVGFTGVNFTDNLPVGLVVATPSGLSSSCGGTVTAIAGSGVISLIGGTIGQSANCVFSVNVTGTTAGVKNNITGNVSSTEGGTGNTGTASVTVLAPPTISKAFGTSNIPLNGTTTLTLTIANPNSVNQMLNAPAIILFEKGGIISSPSNLAELVGIAVTDTFPAGLVVATPNGLANTCGGSVTATAGSGSVSLSGGTIPASGSCTVTVNVTGTTSGTKVNTTGTVSSTNGGTGLTATANLTVAAPPTIAKAFGASTIPLNGSTSMTLTIANPNAGVALSGIAVTDSLPAGLVVATPNGLTGSCGGSVTAVAGSGSVSLTGGALAASANCTVTVNVTGTTAGVKNNITGNISSTEGGAGGTGSATVTVVAPPAIAKAFGASTIPLNGSTSLTFTITNSNSTVGLTGVAMTDNLPAGLVVATPNGQSGSCGGTVTAVAGSSSVSLTGGTIGQSANCVFSVNVTGTTAGAKNNTTGNVGSTEGGTGNTGTASVTVLAPPTISKAFGASNIPLNGTTTLTLTIGNPNSGNSLTGVAVTDTFPAGLVVSTPNGLANTCGGSVTAVAGSGSVTLSGGTIAASGSCAVTVNVTGTTPGSKVNTTGAVSSTNGGTGLTASATIQVNTPPTINAVANSRQQGSPSSNSTIATVNDADQTEDTLVVTVNGGASATVNGVTVSNIAVSAAGTVTADVVASCTATNATFTLRVTDDANAFTEATLNVTVTANTPPVLTYSNQNVMEGNGLTVNAATGPSDNGSVTSVAVKDKGTFTGTVSVNLAGVVTISGAAPVGSHTITIRATDNCGATTDASFVVAVSGVTAGIADPAVCNGPGGLVDVTATVTNGSNSPQPATFTATLPAGLLALPGTCTSGTGSCSIPDASTVNWSGTLGGGQTVTIRYKAQFADTVQVGTQLCITSTASVGGSATASVQACATVTCPSLGPGLPFPTENGVANDQKAGSILIYNLYSSSTNPNLENTRINLTNIDPSRNAYVHLYFVEGASCSVADMYLCLTPNQTTSFVTSDFDPGTTGYLVAVAVDRNGCPINFNYLIGDAYVKFASGHAANLSAISVAAKAGGPLACGGDTVEATLKFDGVSYDVLPQVLALDNIPSRADGNETMLVLNRIGGSLSIGAAKLAPLFGLLFDDQENGISFTLNPGTCQYRTILSNTAPRTVPRFEQFIPAGRSGWMKLWQTGGAFGMTGSMINFNPNAAAAGNAFNQGHNLHVLTTTSSMSYTIPVFPAGC